MHRIDCSVSKSHLETITMKFFLHQSDLIFMVCAFRWYRLCTPVFGHYHVLLSQSSQTSVRLVGKRLFCSVQWPNWGLGHSRTVRNLSWNHYSCLGSLLWVALVLSGEPLFIAKFEQSCPPELYKIYLGQSSSQKNLIYIFSDHKWLFFLSWN